MLYNSNSIVRNHSNHEIISHPRSFDFQRIHRKGAFALSSISATDNPFVIAGLRPIKPSPMGGFREQISGTNNVTNCYNRFHPIFPIRIPFVKVDLFPRQG